MTSVSVIHTKVHLGLSSVNSVYSSVVVISSSSVVVKVSVVVSVSAVVSVSVVSVVSGVDELAVPRNFKVQFSKLNFLT